MLIITSGLWCEMLICRTIVCLHYITVYELLTPQLMMHFECYLHYLRSLALFLVDCKSLNLTAVDPVSQQCLQCVYIVNSYFLLGRLYWVMYFLKGITGYRIQTCIRSICVTMESIIFTGNRRLIVVSRCNTTTPRFQAWILTCPSWKTLPFLASWSKSVGSVGILGGEATAGF